MELMVTKKYDFIVIGAGSGGVRAARLAAAKGLKTLIIEGRHWGGTCVNLGCVPKKFLVFAADYGRYFNSAVDYGWDSNSPTDNSISGSQQINWDKLRNNINQETTRLQEIYCKLLNDSGVDMVNGYGYFLSPNEVAVVNKATGREGASSGNSFGRSAAPPLQNLMGNMSGKAEDVIDSFSAPKILIASGGTATKPNIPGNELGLISDDMFSLPTFPRKLCILGGGYIALEFACIFAALGSEVTLINRSQRLLRGFDEELAEFANAEMQKHNNIKVMLNSNIESLNRSANSISTNSISANSISTNSVPANKDADGIDTSITVNLLGKSQQKLTADAVLFATGRKPNTSSLQLNNVFSGSSATDAVSPSGAIEVNDYYESAQKGIFAIGDVINRVQLTPVAIAEAKILIASNFGEVSSSPNSSSSSSSLPKYEPLDYKKIPAAVFCRPEIAAIGLSEELATKSHNIEVYKKDFIPMQEAFASQKKRFFIKLICEKGSNKILGIHIAGQGAAEMMQGFAVGYTAGLSKDDLLQTIGIHPTIAEELVTM